MMSKKQKSYHLTENNIVRISCLFACMEEAVKEIIRSQHPSLHDSPLTITEMRLKEEIFKIQSNPLSIDLMEF